MARFLTGYVIVSITFTLAFLLHGLFAPKRQRGIYISNSRATLTLRSSCVGTRIIRPRSIFEVLFGVRANTWIAKNEILIIKTDVAEEVRIKYVANPVDPDIILQGSYGHMRLRSGESATIMLSPDHDSVARTELAYEPTTGIPLRSFA